MFNRRRQVFIYIYILFFFTKERQTELNLFLLSLRTQHGLNFKSVMGAKSYFIKLC